MEKDKETQLSRRQFLKDAGLVVGGSAVGSVALLSACGSDKAETITKTVTETKTVTKTVKESGGDSVIVNEDDRSLFNVNGKDYKVKIEPYWTLSFVIRECLGLTATKVGCDRGECGHCTVLMDGKAVYSCLVLAIDAIGKKIETAESLCEDKMHFDRISQAFLDNMAYQCGFCTAGFMMATKALLADYPNPSMERIQKELGGHICVCSAIPRVLNTVYELGGGK